MSDSWEKSNYTHELPIDGSADSEFLKMGIEFGPFNDRDKWRGANIPSGWTIDKSDKSKYVLLDLKRRLRAVIYPKNHIHMRPVRRFRYGRDPFVKRKNDRARFCIWDRNAPYPEEKVVFEKYHTVPDKKRNLDVYNNRVNLYKDQFDKLAINWFKNNFPKWEGYNEYWE